MDRIANATTGPEDHEIEITDEMIEAGCREFALCESFDPPWSTVISVYRAMEVVRRRTSSAPLLAPLRAIPLSRYK